MIRKLRDPERRIEVRRFAGPAGFVGAWDRPFRVVHITDEHVGRVTPMSVQAAAVDLALAEEPDVVLITGDFACHSHAYLEDLRWVIDRIDAPKFGVLGNHDYWAGAPAVRGALKKAGLELLTNQHTTLDLGHGRRLQIVGVDDAYTGHADIDAATRGLRRDLPTVAMSHIAEEADALWARGVPLVLSGHTHAGQITVARLNELAIGRVVGHRYVHGLYGTRADPSPPGGAVYVGAGVGAAMMPFRWGERGKREVTVFDLGTAPGDIDEHHDEQDGHPGRAPSPQKQAARAKAVQQKKRRRERRDALRNSLRRKGSRSDDSDR